jgi:hypothetical protein
MSEVSIYGSMINSIGLLASDRFFRQNRMVREITPDDFAILRPTLIAGM